MDTKALMTKIREAGNLHFRRLGYRKRSGEIFTLDLTADAIGWLGLNKAVRRREGVVEINPVVGVRHQVAERLLADIQREKFHPYTPPTISVHLGYLAPENKYTPWLFDENHEPSVGVAKLAESVAVHGIPFMRANAGLEKLVQTLESSKFGVPEQTNYRLPIVYHLVGKDDLAEDFVERQLGKLEGRNDLAARAYREFSDCFLSYLKEEIR